MKKNSETLYTLFVILVGFLILAIYFSQMNPARAQTRPDPKHQHHTVATNL